MRNLKKLTLLQLVIILKGFLPKLYVRVKKNRRVIVKRHMFSFKKLLDTDVNELITSIIPKYLSLVNEYYIQEKYIEEVQNLLANDVEEEKVVEYLYDEYIGLSHKINRDLTNSIINNLTLTKFKRVNESFNFDNLFKKKEDPEKKRIEYLEKLPSNTLKPLQKEILKEKKELLFKSNNGKIVINTDKTNKKEPSFRKSTNYDGHEVKSVRVLVTN
ncbi:MAG: hypothetical protein ACOCT9_02360 [archaeon]